ncbi:MAG: hypothetical protein V4671_15540 [Armatimonadota bacterium]
MQENHELLRSKQDRVRRHEMFALLLKYGTAAGVALTSAGASDGVSGGAGLQEQKAVSAVSPVMAGQAAPLFTLQDAGSLKPVSLKSVRGRPVTLFFFCGCTECFGVAKAWAYLQRSGALASRGTAPAERTGTAKKPAKPSKSVFPSGLSLPAVTVVVYSGGASGAKDLSARAGLDTDSGKTVLLTDPDLRVTDSLYHVESCPRSVVLDAAGIVRYADGQKEGGSSPESADVIVAKTFEALRHVQVQGFPRRADGVPARPTPKKVN